MTDEARTAEEPNPRKIFISASYSGGEQKQAHPWA